MAKNHRIIKYAKPHIGMICLAIALLFAQANFDLALPDYMSDIVDTGIQQQGIENTVPIGIRTSEMDKLRIFMSNEEETLIFDEYFLIDSNNVDYDDYLKDFPILENESIYALENKRGTHIDELNPKMAELMLTVFTLKNIYANPENISRLGLDFPLDVSLFPTEAIFFQSLDIMMNSTSKSDIREGIVEAFSVIGDIMVDQVAIVAIITEYEIMDVNIESIQIRFLLKSGALMLLMTLASVVCTITVGLFAARISAAIAREVRKDVFERVEKFSSAEFDSFSTASLITRTTNDVTQIQMMFFIIVRMVFYAPIIGIGGVIRAIDKAKSMWWIVGLAVLSLIAVILTVFSVAFPKFKIVQKLIDRLNLVSRENLSGMMVIRAFNMQEFEENRFNDANKNLANVNLFINRIMVVLMPFMMLIMNGLMLAIIWVGSHEVSDGLMQVGDMMAFMQYAMQIVMAFLMLTFMFIILPRASVSAERVKEVLNTKPYILDPPEPYSFNSHFQGKIEFRNVSFRYPSGDDDALQNISFTAHPGQTTAFIGATGSGKSTVVNLIPRFYEVTSGSILIDDIDIRHVTQHDLREKIGYIPQKSSLFSGTIKSNMRYANDQADDEQIKEAITTAQAAEFVYGKDAGVEQPIAQGGSNVSGGQKQRLSIARALIKKPPIYIFDDSFSALDFKTDAALRKALKTQTGDSTILIVTQRVSTIMNAEQIVVLDEGVIIGKGTHDQLLETCETYREIAVSQLALEETS